MLNAYTPGESIAKKELNQELNGVELYFIVYPLKGTRETLKHEGFKWNHKKSCWYAKQSPTTLSTADVMEETSINDYKMIAARTGETVEMIKTKETAPAQEKKALAKPKAEPKANKYGVKVGDFFSMQWGYEQTNNNYFQVVALVGTSSVRIREVNPPIIAREASTGMSEDRTYKLDRSQILPPSSHTCFIKDQDNGDLKRLKSYAADGVSNPQINMTSYADAHYCNSESEKVYESWYY